jgi:hypothetical protein
MNEIARTTLKVLGKESLPKMRDAGGEREESF